MMELSSLYTALKKHQSGAQLNDAEGVMVGEAMKLDLESS